MDSIALGLKIYQSRTIVDFDLEKKRISKPILVFLFMFLVMCQRQFSLIREVSGDVVSETFSLITQISGDAIWETFSLITQVSGDTVWEAFHPIIT